MTRKIPIFTDDDLPNGASHCPQAPCGFSLYRGVLVQWDKDRDERILDLLDQMAAADLEKLLVVQEHEGTVSFLWADRVPDRYNEGNSLTASDGDEWCIDTSKYTPRLTFHAVKTVRRQP